MANEAVEWITLHAEKGDHLAVDGDELRTLEAVAAWEPLEKRWTEEAINGVEVRRREDVGRIRTLGRRPLVPAPMGNPYWTLPRGGITHSTSSVECAESTLLSRLHDRVESLKEIARDWRVNAPEKPIRRFALGTDVDRGYSEHVKSTRAVKGHAPTEAEDIAWGADHGLKRVKVRGLRKNSPDRTAKDRRDTNPAKK